MQPWQEVQLTYLISQAPVINGNQEEVATGFYTTYIFNLPDSSFTGTVAPRNKHGRISGDDDRQFWKRGNRHYNAGVCG